jgi:hypothetical protein
MLINVPEELFSPVGGGLVPNVYKTSSGDRPFGITVKVLSVREGAKAVLALFGGSEVSSHQSPETITEARWISAGETLPSGFLKRKTPWQIERP